MTDLQKIPRTPAFVLEMDSFRKNLAIISGIQMASGCSFLMALKGFAMHRIFPELAEAVRGATASSLFEALLADEYFNEVHAYAPAYKPEDFDRIASLCTHVTFNSLHEYETYRSRLTHAEAGLRINPRYSPVETDLYNPCAPGSRLGIEAEDLSTLPKGVTGLHSHNLCESGADALHTTISMIESRFGHLLNEVSWLNLGGGHLVTRKGYDIPLLLETLRGFQTRHPHIQVILEPGAAFVWETGVLVAQVLDIVQSKEVPTAMLDTSFAAHMPDCIEMPYTPRIRGASIAGDGETGPCRYRMGGSTCLAGDAAGDYLFPHPLKPGDRVVFEDMMHYTMVKTNMFNGINLPDIGIIHSDGTYELVKSFTYEDYRGRLS